MTIKKWLATFGTALALALSLPLIADAKPLSLVAFGEHFQAN